MLKDTDTRRSHNTEHSYHGKHLVTDGRGRNGKCCMMSMQLTDKIVTKIKNGYYENELFPFADLFREKLEKDEAQTSQ